MSQSQQHATTCKPKRVMRLLCRNNIAWTLTQSFGSASLMIRRKMKVNLAVESGEDILHRPIICDL